MASRPMNCYRAGVARVFSVLSSSSESPIVDCHHSSRVCKRIHGGCQTVYYVYADMAFVVVIMAHSYNIARLCLAK